MSKSRSQYRRFTRAKAGNVMYFTILILAGAFSVLPLIYCVVTSFKPLDELLIFPPTFFVKRPTIGNYKILPDLMASLNVLAVVILVCFYNSVTKKHKKYLIFFMGKIAKGDSVELSPFLLYKFQARKPQSVDELLE